ncbi:MAG TPA: hypothetical protein PLL20_17800 [Phycisphaerae bacterium]|nr:hypothetical protein [Phycisphaerae bacterium]HRR86753.1 hypothetical protein [Phycisphaerae bacterium]
MKVRRGGIRNRLAMEVLFLAGYWLFQGGCLGFVQRELEVLVAAESNGVLIRSSFLYEVFGPRLIALANQWL